MKSPLQCELRPLPRYISCLGDDDNKNKFGRYHNSIFWDIPDFGCKKWVVGVRIDLNFDHAKQMNLSDDNDIINECVKMLNQPPPRKKFARRVHQPKYGKLSLYKAKIVERENDKFISALLITDQRSNKYFWGKGQYVVRSKK